MTRNDYSEVHIKMPKFNIEADVDVSELLGNLGVKKVFSGI